MNYPYPIPGTQQGSSRPTFVADGTHKLGSFTMSVDTFVGVTVDYSQLAPAMNMVAVWFKIKPGGEPALVANNAVWMAGTPNVLSFALRGGIPGRSYDLVINTRGQSGGVRTDVLTVNVEGGDCGCAAPMTPTYPPGYSGAVSGDGSVIVNTSPRFFVSGTTPVGANVLDRWYDTANGDIYDYVSNGIFSYWQLATIGGGSSPVSAATILKINPIIPDGITAVFTLTTVGGTPVNVVGSPSLFVSVDGVWQEPEAQFLAGGDQINFNQPPAVDSRVFMVWFSAPTTPEITDGANIVKVELLNPSDPDGITVTFALTATDGTPLSIAGSNSLFVSVDGVWQEPTIQYVAALNMITFIAAPSADSSIFMLWFAPPPLPAGP